MDEWLQLKLGAMIRCCLFPHFPNIFRTLGIRLASNDLHHVGAYNLMNEAVLMVSTAKVCLITTYKVQQFREVLLQIVFIVHLEEVPRFLA